MNCQDARWSPGRRWLVAAGTALGVFTLYLAVAAVAHAVPFAAGSRAAAATPAASAAPSARAAPRASAAPRSAPPASAVPRVSAAPRASRPGPALAAGVAPLTRLLPGDIEDPAASCTAARPPFQWSMPGLVQALACTDPGLPGGQVFAYQLDGPADFQTAWRSFNDWWGITRVRAGQNCPPPAGGAGSVGIHNAWFPDRPGQVLECEMVGRGGGTQPAYAWAWPSEDAFLVAQAAHGSSFTALDTWWTNRSVPGRRPG